MSEDIIYHYTSPEGLKAILENRSLRFTDYRFLNDKNEGVGKKNSIICKIESLKEEKNISPKEKDFLNLLLKEIEKADLNSSLYEKDEQGEFKKSKYNYYVFSMSKERDSLPMWNYYVKNKRYEGYNIGFEIEKFKEYVKNLKIKYENISYEYENKESDNIEKTIKSYQEKCLNTSIKKMKAVFECRNELLMNYIFSKGSCFEHEKEFRVVLKLSSNIATNKEDFCIKNGILVPYIDIDIEAKEFKKMIKSITISPLLEKEIAKKGLEKFLVKNGYEIYSEKSRMGIKIETSNCPIRY